MFFFILRLGMRVNAERKLPENELETAAAGRQTREKGAERLSVRMYVRKKNGIEPFAATEGRLERSSPRSLYVPGSLARSVALSVCLMMSRTEGSRPSNIQLRSLIHNGSYIFASVVARAGYPRLRQK